MKTVIFHIVAFVCALMMGSLSPSFARDITHQTSSTEPAKPGKTTTATVTTKVITVTETIKHGDKSTIEKQHVKFVEIKGSISRSLLANLKKIIQPLEFDTVPAGLIVFLDSKGGDGMAAIEIGKILRNANAHVFVNGECASACVFVLAGGVVRGAPAFSVGIHRARITMSSDAGVIKKEVDANQDLTAQALLAKFDDSVMTYFSNMGIPQDLFIAMQSHPTKNVYRLSSHELGHYGLNGVDRDYLQLRTQMYANMPGRWPKDTDELFRRSSRVSAECVQYDPVNFTKCYRRVLQDMF